MSGESRQAWYVSKGTRKACRRKRAQVEYRKACSRPGGGLVVKKRRFTCPTHTQNMPSPKVSFYSIEPKRKIKRHVPKWWYKGRKEEGGW